MELTTPNLIKILRERASHLKQESIECYNMERSRRIRTQAQGFDDYADELESIIATLAEFQS